MGRELVKELINSKKWSKVTVVVRRKLEEWEQFNDNEKAKLEIICKESLDSLEDVSQWKLEGYSSVFCCLGTQTKVGKEQFIKVDYTYPLYGGQLALHFKVPHYSIVSSYGADSKSILLYTRTKGEVESSLRELNLPHLSVARPGFLQNRGNDMRVVERIASIIPMIPKIDTGEVARALRIEAELQHESPLKEKFRIYSNNDLIFIAKNETYPPYTNI